MTRAPTRPVGDAAASAVPPLSPGAQRRRERGPGGEAKRPLAGFVMLIILCAVLSYYLRLTGAGLPLSVRALPTGQIGMTDSCAGEREVAHLLAQAPPTSRVVIAGWPGFAVSLFSARSAGVIVDNSPAGRQEDALYRDDLLILRHGENHPGGGKSLREAWQARQPAYLKLAHQTHAGTWDVYKAVVVPVIPSH